MGRRRKGLCIAKDQAYIQILLSKVVVYSIYTHVYIYSHTHNNNSPDRFNAYYSTRTQGPRVEAIIRRLAPYSTNVPRPITHKFSQSFTASFDDLYEHLMLCVIRISVIIFVHVVCIYVCGANATQRRFRDNLLAHIFIIF